MRPLTKSPVSRNLEAARKASGLSQEDLAREAGLKLRRLQRWLAGENEPSYAWVEVLARILGQETAWFYEVHEEIPA